MYGRHLQQSTDQPGMTVNPARGQLNSKMNISLSSSAPENLVSRDGFGRPIPRQPAHSPYYNQAESGAYSRDFSRFPRGRLFICTAIRSVPSLSGGAIGYRWRSLPRFRRHRASGPQGSCSNGYCLSRCHHGLISVRLSSPTPTTSM